MTSKQSVRQAARREAFERQTRRRQEQAQRDKRREGAVLDLVVALRERGEAEERAAAAVRALVGDGLTPQEISEWLDGELTSAEATRLAGNSTRRRATGGSTVKPELG